MIEPSLHSRIGLEGGIMVSIFSRIAEQKIAEAIEEENWIICQEQVSRL